VRSHPSHRNCSTWGLTVADEVLVRSHETTPFSRFDPGDQVDGG